MSAAGKEILIKFVIQALPQYVMMIFKIPVSLCKRLSSIMHSFWWSHTGNKAIHWGSKFLLSRSKDMSGMNFRDFEVMNDALLVKLFWRILNRPNSLISHCLKARYFSNTNLPDFPLRQNSSSVWKGIWNAGMRVRSWIGLNQDNTPIWRADHGGYFPVNSTYTCLKESRDVTVLGLRGEILDTTESTLFWKIVWRSKVQENVKIFIWRTFHNFLSVCLNLHVRDCDVRANCWFCDSPEESADHVFFNCWTTSTFWSCLGYQQLSGMDWIGTEGDWLWH